MRKLLRHILSLIFLLGAFHAFAQDDVLKMKGGKLYLRIYNDWSQRTADSILALYDVRNLNVERLRKERNTGDLAKEGWVYYKSTRKWVEIESQFSYIKSDAWEEINPSDSMWSVGEDWSHTFTDRTFGYNEFKMPSVIELPSGKTRFFFDSKKSYQTVYLSGTFNSWSTGGTAMRRVSGGWEVELELKPGKHEYKFIADGKWLTDTENLKKIDDGVNGFNSVYFKPNHVFELKGYTDVKEVILTGSFNDWDEEEIKMEKTANGWRKAVFFPVGTYAYKFKLGQQWITDPANADVRPDGAGNMNSFLNVGDAFVFRLNGYERANQVLISGSFNGWNPVGLVMYKSKGGWELPIALPSDNYQYKFVVDGKWMCDNTLPKVRNVQDGEENNVVTVGPNYTFSYTNPAAKQVYVTGSFVGWMEPGIPMVQTEGVWKASVYVPQGRATYKFVVDGDWIKDPNNSIWEENEFGTGNSVLLMK